MIRKKKLYARPMKLYEKARILEENALRKKYGLKNKREIWKNLAKIDYFRKRAMALAKSSIEDQDIFFKKLNKIGLNVESISDVLDLQIEDLLQRRLPTIVAGKKIANSVQHARQMVVHKKILVGGKIVDSPSYLVAVEEEKNIKLKEKTLKAKQNKEIIETIENVSAGGSI